MSLKSIVEHYIEHQRILLRRTHYDLERAKIRAHILEGLIIAIQSIDKVISIIRSSKNPKEARLNLKKNLNNGNASTSYIGYAVTKSLLVWKLKFGK